MKEDIYTRQRITKAMNELWNANTQEEYDKIILGKIVYKAYTPQRVGKVIKTLHPKKEFDMYEVRVIVKWLTQTKKYPDKETIVRGIHLQDFEALLFDHHKKYTNHLKVFEKAKKL